MPMKMPKTKAGKKMAVKETMDEFKKGKLRSGSKDGPKVKNPKQAISIAMKESGQDKKPGAKMARNKRLADAEL